jgi:hypothetical protein
MSWFLYQVDWKLPWPQTQWLVSSFTSFASVTASHDLQRAKKITCAGLGSLVPALGSLVPAPCPETSALCPKFLPLDDTGIGSGYRYTG